MYIKEICIWRNGPYISGHLAFYFKLHSKYTQIVVRHISKATLYKNQNKFNDYGNYNFNTANNCNKQHFVYKLISTNSDHACCHEKFGPGKKSVLPDQFWLPKVVRPDLKWTPKFVRLIQNWSGHINTLNKWRLILFSVRMADSSEEGDAKS